MKTPLKFLGYAMEIAHEAKEKHEAIFGGVVAAVCIGLLILKGNVEFLEKHKDWTEVAERFSGVLFAVWAFVWLPFRKHEKHKAAYEDLKHITDTRVNELNTRLNDRAEAEQA